jgi:amino acid adenylation domain-containing protein
MPGVEEIAFPEGCQRLSPSDQLQILNWNKAPISSVNACIHELILQRCQQHPDRIAVSAWDGELTYEQLDRHSAALAHLLHEYAIGPEIFIPICFEKTRWTVVAILGILRAGAAFVLLDPSYPVQRLGDIFQEVAAPFLIATISCAKIASELSSKVIIIDGESWTPSGAGIEPLLGNRPPVKPSNAAYAVFTSGTTGKPKGVVIEHAAFASMAIAQIERIPFTPQARLLQFSSYAFDVSISDQLLSLMAGSCICVPSEIDRQENLQGFINEHQVNCAFVTASVARLLSPDAVPSLQLLGLGGEKVARSDIETWSPYVRLLGEYGPAECSVTCAVNLDLAGSIDAPCNIGFPLAARFWVTDPENADLLMPVGSPGELVIEGPTLARGYLNDPDRTDAAFVRPDWLWSLRGERSRVYRTGDLVRYERDGSLVFLGRKDAQVKINGQRVELQDIEHYLRKCFPGALDIIAEVVSFGAGETSKLVAFVKETIEGEENRTLTLEDNLFRLPTKHFQNRIAECEAALLRQLPRYMVPSLFFPVVHMPITTSGKANRRALQEMVVKLSSEQLAAYRGDEDGFNSPVNAMEEKLRRLWAKTLRTSLSTIGRHSNWWRLGGDSLQAIRLVGELQMEQLFVTVREIFEHPVLADMAAVIKRQTASSKAVTIPEPFELLGNDKVTCTRHILAVREHCGPTFDEIEDIYPCSSPQALIIQMSLQNIGNFTLLFEGELQPGLDRDRFVSAWHKVVEANPMLRTRLVPIGSISTDGEFHQIVLKQASIPVERLDSRNGDFDGTFDIWGFNRPLIRLATLEDRFLIMIHHVAYDLFSFAQMFAQLREAYEGRDLPYRPYSPFVRWERCSAPDTVEFWKKTLAGFQGKKLYPPLVPSANYTPTINSQLDTQFPITIEASHHGTLASKLYLALAIAISHELDNSDIIFGGSFIRRGASVPGITEMMGPTTCILPVRIQLDREDTLLHAQQKVAHQLIEMSEFEDIDTVRIGGLGPDATAACKLRTTVVIMQDEVLQGTSYFFARTWQHKNMGFPTALLLMCSVSSGSAVVQAMHDQNILTPARMQQLLNRLAQAVQFIEEEPHTKVIDLVSAQHVVKSFEGVNL